LSGSDQSARRDQKRQSRQGKPDLLRKDDGSKHKRAMLGQKVYCLVHRASD
jgi:hypothetical protein